MLLERAASVWVSVMRFYSSNVFIVSDNVLCTPALSNQVLDGVTRAIILACAEAHHLKTFVGPIEESRVVHADESMFRYRGYNFTRTKTRIVQ